MCLKIVVLLLICEYAHFSISEDITLSGREKRTIDSVLRSVADAFGYDILKRPTVLPPSPTTPAPVVSTFFPPPVAPLPLAPRPKPKPAAQPQPQPLPQPQPQPQPQPLPNPNVLGLPLPKAQPRPLPTPRGLIPLPKAPPQPPKAPPAPAPAPVPQPPPKAPAPPPPPPKAPAPPAAAPPAPPKQPPPPPLLTETIRKTFNLNFNWNKDVQPGAPAAPGAPGAPAPAAPAGGAVPPKASPVPQSPPAAPAPPKPVPALVATPVPPSAAVAAVATPLPAVPARPGPGGQHFLHKPQLYRQPTQTQNPQGLREQFEKQLELDDQQVYDYPEYQNLNQDYSETKTDGNKDCTDSKERFKESVGEFWKNYPFTEQQGYKYIAVPKQQVREGQFSVNFPKDAPNSKYEEYEILPQTENVVLNEENQPSSQNIAQDEEEVQNVKAVPAENEYEDQAYVVLAPRDYAEYDEPQRFSLNEQNLQPSNTYVKNQYVGQKPRGFSRYTHVTPQTKKRNNNSEKQAAESVAQPLFSGILPVQLHHLSKSESFIKPWSSVPYYDYEFGATENKHSYAKKENSGADSLKRDTTNSDYTYECCGKQTAGHKFDFYTVPEPTPVDYSKYEKLHTDGEDDRLSKNAKIHTKEKKRTVVKANKYENPTKY